MNLSGCGTGEDLEGETKIRIKCIKNKILIKKEKER